MTDKEQKDIFARNLNHLLSVHGKSQREVAEAIDVSPQTFNTWCQAIAIPRMGKVQRLADYFNIPKSHLIDEINDTESSELNELEQKILELYRTLPDSKKIALYEFVKSLIE